MNVVLKVVGALIVILALVIAIVPQFTNCQYAKSMAATDHCHHHGRRHHDDGRRDHAHHRHGSRDHRQATLLLYGPR